MTWVRIDDQAPIHPKLHRAGPEAAWLWVAGLAYCNRFATDGRIDALDLDTLYQYDGWDLAKVNSLAARLVEVGLWEPTKGGWQVHHYAEYQGEALRSARDERRKWEAERKARQRAAAKAKQKSTVENSGTPEQLSQWDSGGTWVGHVPGTQVGHAGGTPARQAQGTPASEATQEESVSQPPDPSRPVPSREEKTPAPPSHEPTPTRPQEVLSLAPPALPTGKPSSKKVSAPLPFTVADAFAVLARASNGRFIPGNREAWKPGVMVNVQKHIRTHPNIAEWERLGRWLAAGGDAFRKDFSFAWAAGNGLLDAMARAAAWEDRGGGVIDPRVAPPATPKPRPATPPTPARSTDETAAHARSLFQRNKSTPPQEATHG